MKHIFVIGSRGYKAKYGGWETFVTNLVDNYHDKETIFHVSGLVNNNTVINDNLIVDNFNIKINGGAKMLLCTIKAFNYYLKFIKKNKIDNAIIYVLGLKLGPMLKIRKRIIKKMGIRVIINPDGLEHERAKWNILIKKFFLFSEKSMLNNCDLIVCDAIGIKNYLDNKYPDIKDKTKYIAYGTKEIDFSSIDEAKILRKYNLKSNDYFLMVGRFVPENNYELVIKSFMKTKINKKLVIVSNIKSSNYYEEILKLTHCNVDKRIIFIDGIYNESELATVRRNALGYIHGHSVGGTNPSLLEALSITDINILYDVCFNKDIGKDACLYFKNESELQAIINNILSYDKKKYGLKCKKIIKNNFTWKIIIDKYKNLFKGE